MKNKLNALLALTLVMQQLNLTAIAAEKIDKVVDEYIESKTMPMENNLSNHKTLSDFELPKVDDLRIATFNVSMHREASGELAKDLQAGDAPQIIGIAEIIQRANPDILLLNEFDQVYDEQNKFDRETTEKSIRDFISNYLKIPQAKNLASLNYPYFFVSPSNTGLASGIDFNNKYAPSKIESNFGFGAFPGQYGMVILSKFPIQENRVRTFQKFRWQDMPSAYLPMVINSDNKLTSFYSEEALAVFRLSSKTHIDAPIQVPGFGTLHLLASHPTPPIFDDGTATTYPSKNAIDWNGLRNHDEIRFWADYIDPQKNRYIYDDKEWDKNNKKPNKPSGGFKGGERFIIVGDLNADPNDGDASFNAAKQLTSHPLINNTLAPSSLGAAEQVTSGSNTETKTANFNLRADYALPSKAGWELEKAWVFWPRKSDKEMRLLDVSDHRMVVVDMKKVQPKD